MLTIVFSRCSRVILYSLEDKAWVANNFPDKFNKDGSHKTKDPVSNVVRAPDEVKN